MPTAVVPFIPETITVHLGAPNTPAQNVTVSFRDYIKNVASSEIYPTWEDAAIRANILAQISFALNRVYLEFYRSRGYDFDITNNTAFDQKFINGRNIFQNIDEIVDDIFDNYLRREGFLEPLAARYCNGTTVTCEGLSQWGSQELAEAGANSVEIVENYYGEDVEIVVDAPVRGATQSYPGTPVRRGDTGNEVIFVQRTLSRISQNYPAIPKVGAIDGVFGESTEDAVREFQRIFNLTPDGIVGKATWYELVQIYVGVNRLAELDSEGQRFFGYSFEYPDAISEGNTGEKVEILQFFLNILSQFYLTIPPVETDGSFGPATRNSVIQAQRQFGVPQTGVVDDVTWNAIYEAYKGIVDTEFARNGVGAIRTEAYPGSPLSQGARGDSVRTLQQYLNAVSVVYPEVQSVNPTGIYGPQTVAAVESFQRQFSLPQTGVTDGGTWNAIAAAYSDILSADTSSERQYPGRVLKTGDRDPR